MTDALSDIVLGTVKPVKTGKIRSIYDLGEQFLFVASDRISAYDHILPNPVPDKGKVLSQLSKFWFAYLKDVVETHFVTDDVAQYPSSLRQYSKILSGRSMLVKKAKVVPIECVVRGYISGSAWSEYKKSGTVNGSPMPQGLKESDKLEKPIFTPSTKEESGHDINISFEKMVEIVGKELSEQLREKSLAVYCKARDFLESRGIILADTKFEFGVSEGKILLIDEVLTPDSSRFWPRKSYQPGKGQESYDKQFVRDYLNQINWDRNPPVPSLPAEIIQKTQEKYREIYKIITGKDLE